MSALRTTQQALTSEDTSLVAAVRRGDDRAFGELYSRYGRRITSYVFGMVGDHGRAEDVTQEVFMSALRQMRKHDRPIAFKPWIYEIARNACIDEFRRSKRSQEVPLAGEDDSEGQGRRLVSMNPTPDTALEHRQQLDDLRGAFRGLSENHHKLIVLRELEGLSYTEIGERMGMTRPVVESTLFRARRRLHEEYQEIASGRRCEQVQSVIAGGERSFRTLGIRERRRLARHVSHCQPCRREAHVAGFDESLLRTPSVVQKVAALLPIPAFLRFRRPAGQDEAGAVTSSHSVSVLQSIQSVAQYADPSAPVVGIGRAAAAVAALAIAGGGVVGVNSQLSGTPSPHRSAPSVQSAAAATSSKASGASSSNTKFVKSAAAGSSSSAKRAGAGGAQAKGKGTGTSRSGGTAAGTGSASSNEALNGGSAVSSDSSSGANTGTAGTSGDSPSSDDHPPVSGQGLPLPVHPTLPSINLSSLPGLPKVTLPTIPQITSGLPQVNLPSLGGSRGGGLVGGIVGGLAGKSG